MLKVNNKDRELGHRRRFGVFIVNFEQISLQFLSFPLSTLNMCLFVGKKVIVTKSLLFGFNLVKKLIEQQSEQQFCSTYIFLILNAKVFSVLALQKLTRNDLWFYKTKCFSTETSL